MKRAIAVLLLAVSASLPAVAAETLQVRSGEHADFSRLVISNQGGNSWRLDTGSEGAQLVIEGAAIAINTSRVFDMIPKTRLASVDTAAAAEGTALQLRLACECHVVAFETPGHDIVIDIKPGAGPAPAIHADSQVSRPVPGESAPQPIANTTDPAQLFDPAYLALPQVGSLIPLSPADLPAETGTVTAAEPENAVISPPGDAMPHDAIVEPVPQVSEAEQFALMEQIARSIDQGIVQLAPELAAGQPPSDHFGPAATPTDDQGESHAINVPSEHAETEATEAASALQEHLNVVTVFERDGVVRPGEANAAFDCELADYIKVSEWASDEPFGKQVAALNSRITLEFDEIDPVVSEALAKLYIRFGFGSEALATLAQMGQGVARSDVLAEMAMIVDEIPFSTANSVFNRTNCPAAALVWTALAPGAPPLTGQDEIGALIQQFSELPIDLRRLLGPRLGEKLLAEIGSDAAEKIYLLVARAAGTHGPEMDLLAARIAHARDDVDRFLELIVPLTERVSATSDRAMLEYGSYLAEAGLPVPEGLAEDVAFRADLMLGTELGDRFQILEIQLMAGSSHLTDALRYVDENRLRDSLDPETYAKLVSGLFMAAENSGAYADDYVRGLLQYSGMIGLQPGFRDVRLDAAAKLRELGLPETALEILAPLLGQGDEAGRLEAARSALDLSEPVAAKDWLAGLPGSEAEALRQRAIVAQGESLTANTDAPVAPPLVLAAGDWAALANGPDPELAALADYVRTPPGSEAPERPITLAEARTLLEETRSSQAVVDSVLGAATEN